MAGSDGAPDLPLVREAVPRTIWLVASARLREAEGRRVDIEDAGAGANDGDEEGVVGVEDDGVAHEGEGEDGLEDAGGEDVDAFAH